MHARLLPLLMVSLLALAGCGKDKPAAPEQPAADARATRVTATAAAQRSVYVTDSAVGWVEAKSSPSLTAEVDGRLTKVLVDAGTEVKRGTVLAEIDPVPYRLAVDAARADTQRLRALIDNAERQVERQRKMLAERFVTESAVEQAQAELRALQEQARGAQARLEAAERDLANAQVKAPVDGVIDQRLVAAGDFVRKGQPLFRLVTQDLVRVRLPFPETLANRLRVGQPVRVSAPLSDKVMEGRIQELRPALTQGARAIEAILEVPNPGDWRPGGSVRGEVVLDERQSVVVPEAAVVERPAGTTVYVIEDGKAVAHQVKTGVLQDGKVEILEGLPAGAQVAVDGAGFLTDGAPVKVQEPRS